MKAVIWTRYGPPDVLQLQEIEKPAPKDNEILVRIHTATVTAGDCELRALKADWWLRLPIRIFIGFVRPSRVCILGQELAGEVEAVGANVAQFKAGDAVFGTPGLRLGGYAEYTCLPLDSDWTALALKPAGLSYAQAAAIPVGGAEAMHFIKQARPQPGEQVLINGAGGSIGTLAIQLAVQAGAQVTAVDSAAKHEMLRSLGAVHVIDYTAEDFTRNGQRYDVIFDVVGKSHFGRSLAALTPQGRYMIGNPNMGARLRAGRASQPGGKQVFTTTAGFNADVLSELARRAAAGEMRIVIDRHYPLAETAAAHAYVEAGLKQGNVIIDVVGE